MTKVLPTTLGIMALSLSVSANVFHEHDPNQEIWVSVDANYWTSYITEGRDNLEEGSLWSGESLIGWNSFQAGIWYGYATEVDYDELDLLLQYDMEIGPLMGYLNYVRLEFLKDDASDNEIGAGLAYGFLEYLNVAVDLVYSTEAEGAFVTVALGAELPLLQESLIISPYLLQAIDIEYASMDHSGLNNFEIGLTAQYKWSENLSLIARIHHSIAQEGVKDDGLGNETWAIFGVEYFLD